MGRRETCAHRGDVLLDQLLGVSPSGGQAADDDLSGRLPMQLQQRPQGGAGILRAAVRLAPSPVVLEEPHERGTIERAPLPFGAERRHRCRRAGQQPRRIAAGRIRRTEPVAGDNPEVPGTASGVGPPEVAVRIVTLSRGEHRRRLTVAIHGHDFNGVKIVGRETKLATQEPEGAAGDVATHADVRILTERDDRPPAICQGCERLPDRCASTNGDRASRRIELDGLHRRHVDDDPDIGIGDEAFETVPAAGGHDPQARRYRLLDRTDDLRSGGCEYDVVRAGLEALVELFVENRLIAGVARADVRSSFDGGLIHHSIRRPLTNAGLSAGGTHAASSATKGDEWQTTCHWRESSSAICHLPSSSRRCAPAVAPACHPG